MSDIDWNAPFRPEDWKAVYTQYSVSRTGRIRNNATGKILSDAKHSAGYRSIGLRINRLRKTKLVHSVVALAWLGPKPKGKQVNHKDGDKCNNHPSNLEYVTQSENIAHARRIGLMPRYSHSKLCDEVVANIRKELRLRKRYIKFCPTNNQLAKKYGVNSSTIGYIDRGKIWTHVK